MKKLKTFAQFMSPEMSTFMNMNNNRGLLQEPSQEITDGNQDEESWNAHNGGLPSL